MVYRPMDIYSLAYGPLLWGAFIILAAGLAMRLAFFAVAILKGGRHSRFAPAYIVTLFVRAFIPFHTALIRRPFYAVIRYVFHLCLFIVPIWLVGHIALWEESRFEWYWAGLPEIWADRMTLGVIIMAGFFFFRRTFLPKIRRDSSLFDYIFILIVSLPFVSGYLFVNGTLDGISFFRDHLETIHVLSGELFIFGMVFLFCRTKLNAQKCVGCAACETACPTGTLTSRDEGKLRDFYYCHYQCICCGSCVNVCPEDAAQLRHEAGFNRLWPVLAKAKIRSVPLGECPQCGAFFAPEPQLQQIGQKIPDSNYQLCTRCRTNNYMNSIRQTAGTPRIRRSA